MSHLQFSTAPLLYLKSIGTYSLRGTKKWVDNYIPYDLDIWSQRKLKFFFHFYGTKNSAKVSVRNVFVHHMFIGNCITLKKDLERFSHLFSFQVTRPFRHIQCKTWDFIFHVRVPSFLTHLVYNFWLFLEGKVRYFFNLINLKLPKH